MSTVAERLLESWLDSQTERRYQPAFIQMLVSDGWTILHNTRHSPIELGKDVIARDRSGLLHCFQLKGNPGSRVTKSEAASLLEQFHELIRLPPGPEFQKGLQERHVAVFVTNGEIDEEARLLFERAGAACGQPGVAASRYELWARGHLLSMANPAIRVWPASIEATRLILNLLAGDGSEPPVAEDISTIMLSLHPPTGATSPAKTSALSGMLVVSEIIKQRWYQKENHQALHAVTVLTCIAAMPLADNKERLGMIKSYAPLALEHCSDLLLEAKEKNFEPDRAWSAGDILGEIDVMWERRRLVGDCAAIALLGGQDLVPELRSYAADLVTCVTRRVMLWGQAQIPSLIVAFWARSLIDAGIGKELDLAATLCAIERANGGDDESAMLRGPYYQWPDVWALNHNKPYMTESPIFNDTAHGHLHFGRAIMGMLAKRNLKRTCRAMWADHTRVIHEEPDLPDHVFFSAVLAKEGSMRDIQLRTGFWTDLVNEAIDGGRAPFLDPYESLAWLLAAYVSLVPYRAWTRVILWLDRNFGETWYHEGHRPS